MKVNVAKRLWTGFISTLFPSHLWNFQDELNFIEHFVSSGNELQRLTLQIWGNLRSTSDFVRASSFGDSNLRMRHWIFSSSTPAHFISGCSPGQSMYLTTAFSLYLLPVTWLLVLILLCKLLTAWGLPCEVPSRVLWGQPLSDMEAKWPFSNMAAPWPLPGHGDLGRITSCLTCQGTVPELSRGGGLGFDI